MTEAEYIASLPNGFLTVYEAAKSIAARPNIDDTYARDLLHIASDCMWAAEGCQNSIDSVCDWLSHDYLLNTTLASIESECRVERSVACERSTFGMSAAA